MPSELLLVLDSTFYNSLGLVFVTLGVLVTIRFLSYPDLTPDGSFTIAACVFARLVTSGWIELLAVAAAITAGALCGLITSVLNRNGGTGKLVASILTMILAVSCSTYVLGRATVGLLHVPTSVNYLGGIDRTISDALLGSSSDTMLHVLTSATGFCFVFVLAIFLVLLFRSRVGVTIRYLGSALNTSYVANRVVGKHQAIALVVGNGLVAFGGIMEAQRRGGADQGMGLGILLNAIAALIIGESLMRLLRRVDTLSPSEELAAAILGTAVYSMFVQAAMALFREVIDIRLTSVLVIALAMLILHRRKSRSYDLF